ncbi:MAG: catalase family protein [Crocinitomicaceae bacterium]
MSNTSEPLQLGKEYPSKEEPTIIQEMIEEMEAQVDRLYDDKQMKRQVHAKMHGCVKAKFTVAPDLPEDLKVGVFSEPKSFHAWIRFSNASTIPKPDKKKDIRGMAIKLMNVPGEKLLADEKTLNTQDFLLMSSETFFSHNLVAFRQTLKSATAKSKLALLLYFINPKHWKLARRLMKSMIKCENLLAQNYWSTQPFRFGTEDRAVKYFVKPWDGNNIVNENVSDDDYLRINMQQTLDSNSVGFDFYVQLQTDAVTMPIEDPTVPWDSPFQKVASIEIVEQTFDSEEQMAFGQNLSFNAWHSLPEHKPLGSFNRARKVAYETMSKYRHKWNDAPMFEPQDSPDFLTEPFKEENYV